MLRYIRHIELREKWIIISRDHTYLAALQRRVLTIQGHTVGVLGGQDRSQRAGAGVAAGDELFRHRAGDDLARLAVPVALAASVLEAYVLQHVHCSGQVISDTTIGSLTAILRS